VIRARVDVLRAVDHEHGRANAGGRSFRADAVDLNVAEPFRGCERARRHEAGKIERRALHRDRSQIGKGFRRDAATTSAASCSATAAPSDVPINTTG